MMNPVKGGGRMDQAFDSDVFYGCLLKGDVAEAMRYLARFPEKDALYQQYVSVFEQEAYPVLTEDSRLQEILLIYQRYYRDVFYLHVDAEAAAEAMRDRFVRLFRIGDPDMRLGDIEAGAIAEAFRERSYHFLGGRTGGYWGPYAWKTTESKTYDVALPGGTQPYTVRFLDGFISKSWHDYVSFGAISTGGWTDGDGVIQCVRASYNLEDESFTVSLLKHEAQHAMDLAAYPPMSSEDLEYRAKLVELIASNQRNLLLPFLHEADASKAGNGHALAAHRIVEGFMNRLHMAREQLFTLPIPEIQATASALFEADNEAVQRKYGNEKSAP